MPRRYRGRIQLRPRPYIERYQPLAELVRDSNESYFTHQELAKLAGFNDPNRVRALVQRLIRDGLLVSPWRGFFVHASPEKPRPPLSVIVNRRCGGEHGHLTLLSAIRAHDREGSLAQGDLHLRTRFPTKPFQVTPTLKLISHALDAWSWKRESELAQVEGIGEVRVATPLSTALDALLRPDLCGGFLRAARFIATHHKSWTDARLAEVSKEAPQACIQRLGYLLALCGRELPAKMQLHGAQRDRRALPLDAKAPRIPGNADWLWRIQLNVDPEKLREACAVG
jgi:hypothetical protein